MKKTLEVARSVLYEEQNLSCCFNFKRTNLDPNHLTRLDSLYDDMMIQGDLLSRAICSQSLQNVKLIIENGYVIENNESTILKSPLHWAFYCNNKLIFDYFIQMGYSIIDDDIFYDPTHKKDFQFSLYLHFFKNKAKFKNILIYKQLKFDHVGFMLHFKLYKKYGEDQIFDLYESMFRLGFDLSIKKNILNKNDCFYAGVEQNGIEFTQLICCLCQNGITKSIIKYLVNKYLHEYGYEKTQVELIKIIKVSIYYFFYYLTDSPSPRLTSTDLIILLDTLFDLLDENSLKHLRRIFRNNLDELFHNLVRGFIEKYEGKAKMQIEYHLDYLYDRKSFRIFDYFVKYKLFNYRDVNNRLSYLTFFVIFGKYIYKRDVHLLALMILYLLMNKVCDRKKIFEWFRMEINSNKRYVKRRITFFTKIFATIYDNFVNNYHKKTLKLAHIARGCIRDRIRNLSKFDLNKLNLPEHLACFIKESILLNKKDYFEIYGSKINSILEDSEFKEFIREQK